MEREVNCGSTEAGAAASELTKGCWVGEGEGVSETTECKLSIPMILQIVCAVAAAVFLAEWFGECRYPSLSRTPLPPPRCECCGTGGSI